MRKQSGQCTKRDRKIRQKQSKLNRKKLPQPKQAISLASKLRFILPNNSILGSLRFHGNTNWQASQLVILALVWAMAGDRFVTDAFANRASACQVMFGNLPVTTYQGMMNALVRWTDSLMPVLFAQLQRSMHLRGGTYYCICGFVPIAFDGSRATVPRTAANEKAFCAQNYGNGSDAKATKRKGTNTALGLGRSQTGRRCGPLCDRRKSSSQLFRCGTFSRRRPRRV